MLPAAVTPLSFVATLLSSSRSLLSLSKYHQPTPVALNSIIVYFTPPFGGRGWLAIGGEKEIRTLDPPSGGQSVFKTASMTNRTLSFVWVIRFELIQLKSTCFTDKPNSPSLAHSHLLKNWVVQKIRTSFFRFAVECIQPCLPARRFCGWRKIRTFNLCLNRALLCHWAIHPCRPAGTRTLNSRCKRPVLYPVELRTIASLHSQWRVRFASKSSMLRLLESNQLHLSCNDSFLPLN